MSHSCRTYYIICGRVKKWLTAETAKKGLIHELAATWSDSQPVFIVPFTLYSHEASVRLHKKVMWPEVTTSWTLKRFRSVFLYILIFSCSTLKTEKVPLFDFFTLKEKKKSNFVVCCFSRGCYSFIVLLINVKPLLLDFRMKVKICSI